jgi:ribonuclease E
LQSIDSEESHASSTTPAPFEVVVDVFGDIQGTTNQAEGGNGADQEDDDTDGPDLFWSIAESSDEVGDQSYGEEDADEDDENEEDDEQEEEEDEEDDDDDPEIDHEGGRRILEALQSECSQPSSSYETKHLHLC